MVESSLENLQISRKLASVQEIIDVTPIENSDLDIVKVLGWQVVTRKDEFKKGQLVFYFEIDSKLPDDRWCSELEIIDYRVKSNLFGEIISQGLVKPLDIVKDYESLNLEVGFDATELIGVSKYDEEQMLESVVDDLAFPKHLIPITDEPRIQSEPRYLKAFEGKAYVATLKYDGTSASFVLNPNNQDELWVCSRNKLIAAKKKDDYNKTADKYKIKEKLQDYPYYALQGEIYGPGIQKNLLGMKDKTLAIFNIFSLKSNRSLDYYEMIEVCQKLELPYVKAIEEGDCFKYDQDQLMDLTKGTYEGTENNREGLVFRLRENWDTPTLRASFKVINNEYLVTGKAKK